MATATRFRFCSGGEPDPSISTSFTALNGFSPDQMIEFGNVLFDFIEKKTDLEQKIGAFAKKHGASPVALKTPMKDGLAFIRGCIKNRLTAAYVKEDLLLLGMKEVLANAFSKEWKRRSASLSLAVVSTTLTANKLVDLEWKFGVTASTDEIEKVGSTYLQLKFLFETGDGKRDSLFAELTLPQFYSFLAEMERARGFVEFLS